MFPKPEEVIALDGVLKDFVEIRIIGEFGETRDFGVEGGESRI